MSRVASPKDEKGKKDLFFFDASSAACIVWHAFGGEHDDKNTETA
jgi:hypothetical protein